MEQFTTPPNDARTRDYVSHWFREWYVAPCMRGRKGHVGSILADALNARGRAQVASLAASFAAALGPRLAREATLRGRLRDGRFLVVASSAEWAAQLVALESEIVAGLRERLGSSAPTGLSVHVGSLEK